jgi:predicted branched-subunit amino acid permease
MNMSPSRRTTVRDITLVCIADAILAVSYGATAVSSGLPPWVPIVMSLIVFSGGAQIAATGIVLAGGTPFAGVAAGALLNARILPYSFTVADITGTGRWYARLFGAHVTSDETVAFALRHDSPAASASAEDRASDENRAFDERRYAYRTCGIALYLSWNVATVAGTVAGTVIKNTEAFGLDAIFPAVMLALALPAVTSRRTAAAAGTGAVAAVALTPVLPAGLPVLASLGGLAWLWRGSRGRRGNREAAR